MKNKTDKTDHTSHGTPGAPPPRGGKSKKEGTRVTVSTKLMSMTFLLILLSTILLSFFALKEFERQMQPEMAKKARTLGDSVNALLLKAIGAGVPFRDIGGTTDFFTSIMGQNPEIIAITVTGPGGKTIYAGTRQDPEDEKQKENRPGNALNPGARQHVYSRPILYMEKKLGTLNLAVDKEYVSNKLKEILYDVLTVLVISLLLTFELLVFLVTYNIIGPIDSIRKILNAAAGGDFSRQLTVGTRDEIGSFMGLVNRVVVRLNHHYWALKNRIESYKRRAGPDRAAAGALMDPIDSKYRFGTAGKPRDYFQQLLIYIRPPLFLVIFSESLSLSFFPMYVDSLYTPMAGISRELIIGLPISIFMLFWALSLPAAGVWSDRVGRRKPFIAGVMLTALGLLLTGMAGSVLQLLVFRSITAVGYGIVYITCQGYITDNTTVKNRGRGMAIFLSGFFSGALCGAGIGGILAERIGFRPTFFLSAALSLLSALFVYYFFQDHRSKTAAAKPRLSFQYFKLLFHNKHFLLVTFCCAIPAKICLTGFLYYIAPLYLRFLGNNQSAIGKILMAYGLSMIVISPLTGKLADLLGDRKKFVFIGGITAGAGLIMVDALQSTAGVFLAILILGISHGFAISSQLVLVTELCKKESETIGAGILIAVFRLLERGGNISGPLLSGLLITLFGFSKAIAGIGAAVIAGNIICMLGFLYLKKQGKKRN